jgi:uncharacterized protein
MLSVNLRHLEKQEVHLKGELPVEALDFGVKDELVRLDEPLHYDLQVEKLHDALLVTGSLRLALNCECVRCLKKFKFRLDLVDWACHLPLAGEERVSVDNDSVDLTPFVREDMLLEFPQHPLCKPDCAGLKKKKAKEAAGEQEIRPSAWAELDKLKL